MNKEFGANDVLMPFVMDYGNWIVWTERKQENLNQYLGRTQTDPVQEQQTKNKNHSL